MNTKAFFMLVALLGFAHADVMPEGYHGVEHRIYIDNLADYSQYQFIVYPTFVGGGAALVDSSRLPHPYKFAQARLYAVLKSDLPATDLQNYTPDDAISGNLPGFINELPDSDPATMIETHYLVSVAGGNITLTKTSEVRSAGDVQPLACPSGYWLVLPGLAVGAIAGYIVGKRS